MFYGRLYSFGYYQKFGLFVFFCFEVCQQSIFIPKGKNVSVTIFLFTDTWKIKL